MQRLFSFMLCPSISSVSINLLLERVQKRALSIICPSLSYDEALNEAGIPTIISYCEDICDKAFNAALGNKDNKLNKLLTEANKAPYLLRKKYLLSTSKVEHGPF